MGAGGSTAVSCSSLDLSRQQAAAAGSRAQYRRHYLNKYENVDRQEVANIQKLQATKQSSKLQQANSYFDLNQSHLLGEWPAPEVYTLSNANIGHARAIKVLPLSPSGQRQLHQQTRHHNHQQTHQHQQLLRGVGVKSKLQQQAQRAHELRKFSDSLPSLNLPLELLSSPAGSYNNHPRRQEAAPHSQKSAKPTTVQQQQQQQVKLPHLVKHQHQQQLWQPENLKRAISLSSLHQQLSPAQISHNANVSDCRRHSRQLKCQAAPSYRQLNDCDLGRHHQRPQSGQLPAPASPAKKIFKTRQQATGSQQANSRPLKSNKYKQKQAQQVQQAGCPVLPTLPRSQSLHELIQLRSTENGKRMRTTGTLRGPLTSGEPQSNATKVNLVAEILESKRQEKLQQSSVVLSQQSSSPASSDDGIHDLSINKRRKQTGSSDQPNQHEPGKSTLKRSLSHSALHQSEEGSRRVEDDDEEDLNELAKFLYQFKQRQEAKSKPATAAVASNGIGSGSSVVAIGKNPPVENERLAGKGQSVSGAATNQQSPNSTSSSSGFASSSCTSNSTIRSTLSSSGEVGRSERTTSGREQRGKAACGKKYPAPPRPDAAKLSAVGSAATGSTDTNGCPASGKPKLSSSLLSIVDEYNNKNNNQPSNQSSVIVNSGGPANRETRTGQFGSGVEPERALVRCPVHDNGNPDRLQLEQLKRYTQLRQMSQSELALNQLSNQALVQQSQRRPGGAPSSSSSSSHSSQNTKTRPYKSKLINLIKRISDKAEPAPPPLTTKTSVNPVDKAALAAGGRKSCCPGNCSGQANSRKRSCDGESQPAGQRCRAINQSGPIVSATYSNEPDAAGGRLESDGCLACSAASKQQQQQQQQVIRSESFCDLNFDCDFELIKNCGSINNESRRPVGGPSLLATSRSEASNGDGPPAASHYNKQQPKAVKSKQVDRVEPTASSNWRLKPVGALSLASTAKQADGRTTATTGREEPERLQVVGAKAPNWPAATGWLMNAARPPPAKVKQANIGGDCLANSKLVSASGTPANGVSLPAANPATLSPASHLLNAVIGGKEAEEARQQERVSCEANQLLDDLKQTLRQQVGRPATGCPKHSQQQQQQQHHNHNHHQQADPGPFSRKAALSWWQQCDHRSISRAEASRFRSSSSSEENDDDDDEDGADYARINRAMIRATLGVEGAPESRQIATGSPSNSFTFSAPGSPLATPDSGPAQELASAKPNGNCLQASWCASSKRSLDEPRDLHNNGAGRTFCRGSAVTCLPELASQNNEAACRCLSTSSVTSTPIKQAKEIGESHFAQADKIDINSEQTKFKRACPGSGGDVDGDGNKWRQQSGGNCRNGQQQACQRSSCCRHHLSSGSLESGNSFLPTERNTNKLHNNANHSNEDVKLQPCVDKNNLIITASREGQPDSFPPGGCRKQPKGGQKFSGRQATSGEMLKPTARQLQEPQIGCCCCSSSHQSQSGACPSLQLVNRRQINEMNCPCPSAAIDRKLEPEASSAKNGGVARLINMRAAKQSICRSNSELATADRPTTGSGRAPNNPMLLFGKLRNSLLNQPTTGKIVGPGERGKAQRSGDLLLRQHIHTGSAKLDFDDNFILKRKTPNAGLTSRC